MKFVPVAAAAMVGMLLAGPADAQTRRYAGRPVADVLKALESPPGLRFIFTDERVPQALRELTSARFESSITERWWRVFTATTATL